MRRVIRAALLVLVWVLMILEFVFFAGVGGMAGGVDCPHGQSKI